MANGKSALMVLGALHLGVFGCSLRNIDDLAASEPLGSVSDPNSVVPGSKPACDDAPETSECDAAGQATCALKGATCEQLSDRSGCRRSFCRWSAAADQKHCAAVTR